MAGMHVTDNSDGLLAGGADDCEWVVELLDTMAQGDMDATAETLEGLARRLRKASKARQLLTRVPATAIRAAFERRANRNAARPCL
jgi:hypothetical protein